MQTEPQRPAYRKKTRKKIKTRDEWTDTDWKEAVWKHFSSYIRLRDCMKTTGTTHQGKCVTCKRMYPYNKLQAGHFMPGRMDCILFDDEAVHAQCYRCNVVQSGMWPAYYNAMLVTYGETWIHDQLAKWTLDEKKYTINELKALEKYFMMECDNVEEQFNRRVFCTTR